MTRAAGAILVMACRWAGPEGSPTDMIDVDADMPLDEVPAAGDLEGDGASGAVAAGGASGAVAAGGAAGSGEGGGPTDDFGLGGATDGFGEGGATEGPDPDLPLLPEASTATCAAPSGLICNPVDGTGCLPLMQCVVDPAASQPAAFCLFSLAPLAMGCTQDVLSTTCPPQQTCVAGECREYCYCDADCTNGMACTDPSGQGGSDAFRLCARAVQGP